MNDYGALYWQGKTELLEKKPRPIALHKSFMDWPGIDLVPSRVGADYQPPESWHQQLIT